MRPRQVRSRPLLRLGERQRALHERQADQATVPGRTPTPQGLVGQLQPLPLRKARGLFGPGQDDQRPADACLVVQSAEERERLGGMGIAAIRPFLRIKQQPVPHRDCQLDVRAGALVGRRLLPRRRQRSVGALYGLGQAVAEDPERAQGGDQPERLDRVVGDAPVVRGP